MVIGPLTSILILLLNKPEHGQKPQEVKMSSTSFWVQVYDFPCGFMSSSGGFGEGRGARCFGPN